MITDGQKTTPAPWVPFTEAGCDVGGVGTANIELENTDRPTASGDITTGLRHRSEECDRGERELAARADRLRRDRDPLLAGDASSTCTDNARREGRLPARTSPGGYAGFKALFGAKYVDPAIAGGSACVNDTNGDPITDPLGNCGFPGFDGMFAKNTLGYVAADAGVRRPRDLRVHLRRARPARPEPRRRLVLELGHRAR